MPEGSFDERYLQPLSAPDFCSLLCSGKEAREGQRGQDTARGTDCQELGPPQKAPCALWSVDT